MKFLSLVVTTLLVSVILSSCTIEKRQYFAGYHIEWNSKAKRVTTSARRQTKKIESVNTAGVDAISTEPLTASAAEPMLQPTKGLIALEPIREVPRTSGCDTIYFRDGVIMKAKVLELTPDNIKYRYCDNPDGPIITAEKSSVKSISYNNGTSEEFQQPKPNENYADRGGYPPAAHTEANPMSVASLVCGIGSIFTFIAAPAAIITGIIALNQINKEPQRYTGKGMAVTGIVLGSVMMVLLILFIALIFSLATSWD